MTQAMKFTLPKHGVFSAFALVVDINGFTGMVDRSEGNLIAQFVRDVLGGGVRAVESCDGNVVGFMGDAFLGILPSAESVFSACVSIAKDLDRQCEYISGHQVTKSDSWFFAPGGPGLKIGVEYGWLDVSSIDSVALGAQPLVIGPPINYASRIISAGIGNRCLYGRAAASEGLDDYSSTGPFTVEGKPGEPAYQYYRLDMSDIWREGERELGHESFWG